MRLPPTVKITRAMPASKWERTSHRFAPSLRISDRFGLCQTRNASSICIPGSPDSLTESVSASALLQHLAWIDRSHSKNRRRSTVPTRMVGRKR